MMDYSERRECGCKITVLESCGELMGIRLDYCPTHKAAFRLLALLTALRDKTDCNDYNHLEVYQTENLLAEIAGEKIPFPGVVGIDPESEDG